jgi:cyclopropane-fatty-acyl-phospholipid synthase
MPMPDTHTNPHMDIQPPPRPEMYLEYDLAEDTRRSAYQYDQDPEYYLTQNGGEWHVYSCSLWEPGFTLTQAQEKKLDKMAELMELKAGMHILDVGCGWGGPLVYLCRKYGVTGHGIAVAPNQIETARARAARYAVSATFELLHWQNLPEVEMYDAIYSDEVITHFPNLGEFFARCHKLLRAGGTMAHKEVHLSHARYAKLNPLNQRAVKVIAFTANYITLHQELRQLDESGFALTHLFEIPMTHYQRTLDEWLHNIFENRARLKAITSPQWYEDQRAFIKACRYIFTHTENCRLDIVASRKLDPAKPVEAT